ncbi:golgin subfamily A member 2-like isoform X2 [Callithrix jacchus]
MTLPGEGDGGGHMDSEEEEVPRPSIAEILESREAMVAFSNSAGASAQEEQEQLCVQPQERKNSFMTLRKEKVDLKERVEKLELLFIRLSEETDTMRKDIKSCEQQRAVPKTRHQEKGEKQEINLELQKPVFPILGDNEGHAKFLATANYHIDEPTPGAPAPQELGTVNKQGDLCEVSLADGMEPARDAREGSPQDNPTVGNILQPLCEMKTFQKHPGLGCNPYVPLFYRAAKNRENSITDIFCAIFTVMCLYIMNELFQSCIA